MQPFAERTHEQMREVLMDKDAHGPAIHYYMMRGGKQKRNITVLESGTVGTEYIKTYGHYHVGALDETYWVAQGEGFVVLQERKKDPKGNYIDNEISSFKAISIKAGSKVYIPAGVGHLLVNTGNTWLVTIDDSPVAMKDSASMPGHADYEPVRRLRGFAYYCVEKGGKPQFVKNPLYRNVPAVETSI